MKPELVYQRTAMKEAIRWINVIEQCDEYIDAGYQVEYYRAVREEARQGYIKSISGLMQQAIEISKVEI